MPRGMTANQEAAAKKVNLRVREIFTIFVDGLDQIRLVSKVKQNLTYKGKLYYAASIKRSDIKTSTDGKVDKINLTMKNGFAGWAAFVANVGNKLSGSRCLVEEVHLDYPDDPPNVIFDGEIDGPEFVYTEFKCEVRREAVDYDSQSPNQTYEPTCQYDEFKDDQCQYAGSETWCDFTMTRCDQLGNVTRFGGKPSTPKEMVPNA